MVICDFCSLPAPAWRYPVLDIDHRAPDGRVLFTSVGDWLACDPCHMLIETNSMPELAQRAIDRWNLINYPKTTQLGKAVVAGFHERFVQHRRGPAIALEVVA